MSEKPIPVPRPRQTKSTDETDTSAKVYENYTLPINKTQSVYDSLNAQLNELKAESVHRPIPVPRARNIGPPKNDYENSPDSAFSAKPLNNHQAIAEQLPTRTTGAIRKAPNIPSVKNNLDNSEHVHDKSAEERSLKDFDVLSQNSSTSGKSSGDSKYTTPSPG